MRTVIENTRLRVTVEPGSGGKITSLRDLATGREWLWRNPHIERMAPSYGMSYVRFLDTGGWDEIFPSVSPCRIDGAEVPDHGDLVSLPWDMENLTPTSVTMLVATRFAACRFTRSLRLVDNCLLMEYCLENLGRDEVAYLWCAHPLIAIEPGMTIQLPDGTPMTLAGGTLEIPGNAFAWPHLPGLPLLDVIPDPGVQGFEPFAAKIFSETGTVNEVAITTTDQRHFLKLEWDKEDAPFLGIWLNCAAWSGCGSTPYFNLGLEPATAPCDSLEEAIAAGCARRLGPGERRSWSLRASVGTAAG